MAQKQTRGTDICSTTRRQKAPLPRYYKQKIYDESEKEKISFHWKKKSDLLKDKEIAEHGDKLQSFKEEVYFNGNRKMSKIDNSQNFKNVTN